MFGAFEDESRISLNGEYLYSAIVRNRSTLRPIFDGFLADAGINREHSTRDTPQQPLC